MENAFQEVIDSLSTDFYITEIKNKKTKNLFLIGKNVLIITFPQFLL